MNSSALLAIIGMSVATYLTRLSGFYLLRGINLSGPMKAALDALPPAVLMAVIAPVILTTGWAESIAAAITATGAAAGRPSVPSRSLSRFTWAATSRYGRPRSFMMTGVPGSIHPPVALDSRER